MVLGGVLLGRSDGATTKRAAIGVRLVSAELDAPVHVTAPRSEPNRLYVVEQPGRIRVLVNGKLRAAPFLDIRRLVLSGGEQGLLSVAFHPSYAKNRRLYVNYTDLNGDTRVVEYRSDKAGTARSRARAASSSRSAAVPEPQRRPARVRPRRAAVHRHGRRRLRRRSREPRPEPLDSCSGSC